MGGIYLERVEEGKLPLRQIAEELLGPLGPAVVERFCDRDGEYQRKYHVYRVTAGGAGYVLKRSSPQEVAVQERFLKDSGFAVPKYFGAVERDGELWMAAEYVEGPDLRHFTQEMAGACAQTLSEIQNAYWGRGDIDGRFVRYWERIQRRARCLENQPELRAAYQIFLDRQREMPLTLSSGDFLQLNGIVREGRAYIIDWGFGGMMPYALDIARLIAHGVEEPRPGTFPFYMNDGLRGEFVRKMYEGLAQKPSWERYLMDIRLAALNEYIEFIEEDLNELEGNLGEIQEDFYYRQARRTAEGVLQYAK